MNFSFRDEGLRKELKRLADLDQDFGPFLKSIGKNSSVRVELLTRASKQSAGQMGRHGRCYLQAESSGG
ncbi:MAG: hypothetical protein CR993_01880 [Rhodobacterales bacterium]|nr:MAG: hypothetical protein CR993_01880 [Rhodobacterales bacterium]